MSESRDYTALNEADDRILVGRAADGDPAAFEVLVRRYGSLMRAYAQQLLHSNDEVDDVVQEAFIIAWQKLPSLEDGNLVKSWLMRIVSHKSIDRIRSRHPHGNIVDYELPLPESSTPAHLVEEQSRVEALSDALSSLPEQQRQCWILKEIAEYSYDEIAEALDLPVSTVRGLLARARKNIIPRMEVWR